MAYKVTIEAQFTNGNNTHDVITIGVSENASKITSARVSLFSNRNEVHRFTL